MKVKSYLFNIFTILNAYLSHLDKIFCLLLTFFLNLEFIIVKYCL